MGRLMDMRWMEYQNIEADIKKPSTGDGVLLMFPLTRPLENPILENPTNFISVIKWKLTYYDT
jgi:hypothetical protein